MTGQSKNLAGMQEIIKQNGRLTAFIYEHGYPACILWNAGTDDLAVCKGRDGIRGNLNLYDRNDGFFRPVVALSSLSNNLNQTLASGERVLSLLEETPLVEEIPGDVKLLRSGEI